MNHLQLFTQKAANQLPNNAVNLQFSFERSSNTLQYVDKTNEQMSRPEVSQYNSQRTQRKSYKHKKPLVLDQSELWRAFKVHSRVMINYEQCVISLKLLGVDLSQKKTIAKLQPFRLKKHHNQIDFSIFQQIYSETYSKDILKSNYQLFQLHTKGQKVLTQEKLFKIAQVLKWEGDIKQILDNIGSQGKITFQQFNRAVNTFGLMN